MSAAAPIAVRGVSKWYGPVIGLNDVTLDLAPGLIGLLGPNGAGKSTLMKLITGLLRPSIGEVLIHGEPVWRHHTARRAIGYAPDVDAFHEELSGLRFVASMARLSGLDRRDARSRALATLERVGMAAASGKELRRCSKGMRQRVKLAQALVHDPSVLVLDEPLSGVDPAGRIELMELFRALGAAGKTVLISSHILEEVEAVTDRVVLLVHGRVVAAGTVGEIRGLLDEYPLTVRVVADRARDLAAALLASDRVVGVSVEDGEDGSTGALVVKVRNPDRFFAELPGLVTSLGLDVERLEPLDASAAAVFEYLVGAAPGGAR